MERRERDGSAQKGKKHLLLPEMRRFWHLLLLGEDCPREAVGRRGVDEIQHLLVPLLRVDVNREDGAKNLLYGKKIYTALSGESPKNKQWVFQHLINLKL